MEIDESHPLIYQITWSFEVLSFWKLLLVITLLKHSIDVAM